MVQEKFRTILIDPPWPETMLGRWKKTRNGRPYQLPYKTMTIDQIAALPIQDLADENSHIWLWTTNRFLKDGFTLLDQWGFKFLNTITWVKPSGFGAWFVNRTQVILMGYKGKLDMKTRYKPNVLFATPRRHSEKPVAAYELIEAVSHSPRLELFARGQREGWNIWGNELPNDIELCK